MKELKIISEQPCLHKRARFHSIQRLRGLPPVELWHCPVCKSTLSRETVETVKRAQEPVAAA